MNKIHILFIVLFYICIIGALNWGFYAFGHNLVQKLTEVVVDDPKPIENYIYYFIALCALGAGGIYTYHLITKNKEDKKQ